MLKTVLLLYKKKTHQAHKLVVVHYSKKPEKIPEGTQQISLLGWPTNGHQD